MVARKRHASKFVILVVLLVAVTAMADEAVLCGTIMAHADGPDAPGAWRYEMRVSWDNEPASALTHFNVKLDDGENCTYEDIRSYLIWDSPAGEGRSAGSSAMLYFDAVLEMDGDPGLLIDVPLLRYAPNDMSQSRPGPQGVGVFVFWSDLPPWPVDAPNLLLSERFGRHYVFGELEGVFPALPCDPITSQELSWGTVKAGYAR